MSFYKVSYEEQYGEEEPVLRYHLMLSVLRDIDKAREELREGERRIQHLLNDPELPDEPWAAEEWTLCDDPEEERLFWQQFDEMKKNWAAFKSAGGVTAVDFEKWLAGDKLNRIDSKKTRSKRHLRLVASRTQSIPRVRLHLDKPPRGGGDKAA